MAVIGVTGSIGTGKSTVSGMLEKLGARLIDADAISHLILEENENIRKKLVSAFGEEILSKDGGVNRKKLAKIVFDREPHRLTELNSIIQPAVIEHIKKRIRGFKKREHVVVDAPLLIEAGVQKICDNIVVVVLDERIQYRRLKKEKKLRNTEIKARISSQMPLSEKRKIADFIVNNNGSIEDTWKQAVKIWERVK